MVRALRFLTLGFITIAIIGLQITLSDQTAPPRNELVVDCFAADFEFPGRYTNRQSIVVRPAVIEAPVMIEAVAPMDPRTLRR